MPDALGFHMMGFIKHQNIPLPSKFLGIHFPGVGRQGLIGRDIGCASPGGMLLIGAHHRFQTMPEHRTVCGILKPSRPLVLQDPAGHDPTKCVGDRGNQPSGENLRQQTFTASRGHGAQNVG